LKDARILALDWDKKERFCSCKCAADEIDLDWDKLGYGQK